MLPTAEEIAARLKPPLDRWIEEGGRSLHLQFRYDPDAQTFTIEEDDN